MMGMEQPLHDQLKDILSPGKKLLLKPETESEAAAACMQREKARNKNDVVMMDTELRGESGMGWARKK